MNQVDFIITEEDETVARQLVAEGWLSVSNRYRLVVRLTPPPLVFSDATPKWLQQRMQDAYANLVRTWYRAGGPEEIREERELTPAQFCAFKTAGGEAA